MAKDLKKTLDEITRGIHAPEYDNDLIEAVDDHLPKNWKKTDTRVKQVLAVADKYREVYDPHVDRIEYKVHNDISLDVAHMENCTQANIVTACSSRIYGENDNGEKEQPYTEQFRSDLKEAIKSLRDRRDR